ncbi:uncharacterized protein [Halyomorpha halys]|uniref:uncharacterized protein isoform X1 n=1 Tax=Halyomorpha halys TaxID=286706 RepID=UPI0006D50C8B|nr:uncharacterized protein LOC106682458 isoform X1 [Halyomorpha halys]
MGGSNYTTTTPEPSTEPKPTMSQEEYVKIQFYKTYDVMTGVRIAATLGGFFSLMVLLVIYKSKCKSRSLSDENLEAAVAAAVVEEEKLELAFAKDFGLYGGRRSLGNMSAPVSHTRFSSVGGGYSIFTPPVRLGYSPQARVSLPTSSPYIYPSPFFARTMMTDNPSPKSYKQDGEDELAESYPGGGQHLLRVPSSRRSSRSSRRLSSLTCSSCDTSYLERRGSAMEMGRPILPPFIGSRRDRLDEEPWDFYYPIDIQVIQPTPEISPSESQNSLYNCQMLKDGLNVPRIAPLASISSCGLPSIEQDNHSVGSDSVFLDEELVDTEDEVEEFSTDSDAENIECDIPSIDQKHTNRSSKRTTEHSRDNRVPLRRFSTPNPCLTTGDNQLGQLDSQEDNTCPSTSLSRMVSERRISRVTKTSSDSDTIHASGGDEQTCEKSDDSIFVPRAYMSVSCDQLVKILQEHSSEAEGSKTIVEHCTWSQETLF